MELPRLPPEPELKLELEQETLDRINQYNIVPTKEAMQPQAWVIPITGIYPMLGKVLEEDADHYEDRDGEGWEIGYYWQ